jgi:hypothetical protein
MYVIDYRTVRNDTCQEQESTREGSHFLVPEAGPRLHVFLWRLHDMKD